MLRRGVKAEAHFKDGGVGTKRHERDCLKFVEGRKLQINGPTTAYTV